MGSSNYVAWASSVELWCKGQGVKDHLPNIACVVDEKAKPSGEDAKAKAQWEKVDAQLCSLLWRSIDSKLMPLFCPFQTCYSVWKKARALYTNDISRFYDVISHDTLILALHVNLSKGCLFPVNIVSYIQSLAAITSICVSFPSEDWEIADSTLQFWCSLAGYILGLDADRGENVKSVKILFFPVFSALLDALLLRSQVDDSTFYGEGAMVELPDTLEQFRMSLTELLVDVCQLLGSAAFIQKVSLGWLITLCCFK
ncbi:hypothetical protein MTR67_011102 [Solanum verrucosum]|uniref:Uncharacterized protein n=1 Tax=Solanum verrucosum TaxID=315347 RepID=A0AAF0Q7D7_SOLVR|nr:hypothetical protein MTR67_011102 [Solanum verrucosum]